MQFQHTISRTAAVAFAKSKNFQHQIGCFVVGSTLPIRIDQPTRPGSRPVSLPRLMARATKTDPPLLGWPRAKALKAANTIESTPQRVQSKQATAEERITARIRKRQEANSASDHPVKVDVSPEP